MFSLSRNNCEVLVGHLATQNLFNPEMQKNEAYIFIKFTEVKGTRCSRKLISQVQT